MTALERLGLIILGTGIGGKLLSSISLFGVKVWIWALIAGVLVTGYGYYKAND